MQDAQLAVETVVAGLDVVIGTSSFLREHSHGKDMAYITKTAVEVIEYIKSKKLEVRCESQIYSFNPEQNHTCNPETSCCFLTVEFRLSIYSPKHQ